MKNDVFVSVYDLRSRNLRSRKWKGNAMREHYRQKLTEVQDDLVHMGYQVEQALVRATKALQSWDVETAWTVIGGDEAIDRTRVHLEEEVLRLMATQQPLATDLRILLSITAIASELERMGDYTKGIAKGIVRAVKTPRLLDVPAGLLQMAERDQTMVHTCLDAFVKKDVSEAYGLSSADDVVDEIRKQVMQEIVKLMQEDSAAVECAVELLGIVHHLERLGDRTTNIAESVIYIVTSQYEELNA